jgi:hypothetical protein
MAFTCRMKPDLQAEAQQFSDAVGVSLNALVSLSVRDYLDRRTRRFGKPYANKPATLVADLAGKTEIEAAIVLAEIKGKPLPVIRPLAMDPAYVRVRPPRSRADPCPCGAKDALGRPLKYKHCHGAAGATMTP